MTDWRWSVEQRFEAFSRLVSTFPNLLPIILTLGLMGAVGLPLDLFMLLIGTIALGLAVDDTIHFMHNDRRCWPTSCCGRPRCS